MANYYFADGQSQRGPYPPGELLRQGVTPGTLVWTEGMADWQPAGSVTELKSVFAPHSNAPASPPPFRNAAPAYAPLRGPAAPPPAMGAYPGPPPPSNRIPAGVCGILLGALGVHKFILGYTGTGLIMLLVSILSCGFAAPIMHVIGLIEGIIYLTRSDAEFHETYVVRAKSWF